MGGVDQPGGPAASCVSTVLLKQPVPPHFSRRGILGIGLAAVTTACSTGTAGPDVEEHLQAAQRVDSVALDDEAMVNVSGRDFATVCAGEGSRAIMLVTGNNTPMETWAPVQEALGAIARTCAYDRLGIGRSDPVTGRQTFKDMAQDLDGVMTALDLRRPVTLVAHSYGGAIARTWAASHSDDLQALVLVDSATAEFTERAVHALTGSEKPLSESELAAALESGTDDPIGNPERLDDARAWPALAELPGLDDTPVVVLTHGRSDALNWFPPEHLPVLESAWQQAQEKLAATSRASELYKVAGSGHFIQTDRPEVVVAAVLAVSE